MKKGILFVIGFLGGFLAFSFATFLPKDTQRIRIVYLTEERIIDFVTATGKIPESISVLPSKRSDNSRYGKYIPFGLTGQLMYRVDGNGIVTLFYPDSKLAKWFGVTYTMSKTIDLMPLLEGGRNQ